MLSKLIPIIGAVLYKETLFRYFNLFHSTNKSVWNLLQYSFEALFRSEQYALVDNACREYLFVCDFFMVRGNQSLELFNRIMSETLNLLVVIIQVFFLLLILVCSMGSFFHYTFLLDPLLLINWVFLWFISFSWRIIWTGWKHII